MMTERTFLCRCNFPQLFEARLVRFEIVKSIPYQRRMSAQITFNLLNVNIAQVIARRQLINFCFAKFGQGKHAANTSKRGAVDIEGAVFIGRVD